MEQELARVATFTNWPQDAGVQSLTLARQGFYYSGVADRVICSMCSVVLDHWTRNEDPADRHKRLSPMCKFVSDVTDGDMQLKNILMPSRGATTTDDSRAVASDSNTHGRDAGKLGEIYTSIINRAEKSGLLTNNFSNSTVNVQKLDEANLRSELFRYNTFSSWPRGANADPRILAKEGLYYTGPGDKVRCAFCKGSISKWEPEDVPSVEHRRLYPRCPFVLGHEVGNISDSFDTTIDSASNGVRTIETERSTQLRAESSICEELATKLDLHDPPKYPNFSRLSDRIESLNNGNIPQGQTAQGLAEAGWFFVGPGDKVRCFQCGGNLRDWEPNDDPWEEHRRWYKDCAHLKTHTSTTKPITQTTTTTDAVKYRIEPREVKARMDTPTVRAILNMGYENSVVRQVIENQLMTTGDDFPNAESLLEAIFALDDPIPSPQITTSTSHAFITDHSTTRANSSEVNHIIATEGSSRLSPESSAATRASQLSGPQSLTPVKSSLSNGSAAEFLSLNPVSSDNTSASVKCHSQTNSDDQHMSKGKRKKNKKKNSTSAASVVVLAAAAAAVATTEKAKQRTGVIPGVHGENFIQEGIDDEETLQYVEENRRLRDARTCKVCMDADVNTVFLPCGHLVCCSSCAPLLKDCPICRTFIRGTVKTFLS